MRSREVEVKNLSPAVIVEQLASVQVHDVHGVKKRIMDTPG
jgi:hypothetical protein